MSKTKETLTKSEMAGMTVNERLYLSGLWEEFDKAVAENNREGLRTVLKAVHVDSESIETIIENAFSGK